MSNSSRILTCLSLSDCDTHANTLISSQSTNTTNQAVSFGIDSLGEKLLVLRGTSWDISWLALFSLSRIESALHLRKSSATLNGLRLSEIDHSDTYKMLAQEASSINQLPLEILAEIFLLCLEGLRHWFLFDFPDEPRRWEPEPLLLFISTPSMVHIIRDRTFQPHLVSVEPWPAPSRDLPLFRSLASTIFDVQRQTKVVSCSCIQDVWFVFMWNAPMAQNIFRFEQLSCSQIYCHG